MRPTGGAKASAPEWENGGQRGRKKHGALFGGRDKESFICGSLPGSSYERRKKREAERPETERRKRKNVSECGRKIRNANRMPKSDDKTESNLRRGRREGGKEDRRKTRKRKGEVGKGEVKRPKKSGVKIFTRSKKTLLSQE